MPAPDLVIGATGLIGGHIARALSEEGQRPRCLRRESSRLDAVEDLDLEWVVGDLQERDSLLRAMEGCRVVYHAAGYYPTVSLRPRETSQKGVQGMRNVLEAALEAGVERLVYTSSLSTVGPPPAGADRLADERDAYLPGTVKDPYFEVKWLMEQEVWRCLPEGLDGVVVNPTICIGPNDPKPTSGRMLLMVAREQLKVFVDGPVNAVAIEDVAQGHLLAARKGKSGRCYILGGENTTMADLLARVAAKAGVAPPQRTVSAGLARKAAMASEYLATYITRKPPLLPLESVTILEHSQHYSLTRAKEELGLMPTSIDDTIERGLDWFRDQGRLQA